jgi:hypothetical protein
MRTSLSFRLRLCMLLSLLNPNDNIFFMQSLTNGVYFRCNFYCFSRFFFLLEMVPHIEFLIYRFINTKKIFFLFTFIAQCHFLSFLNIVANRLDWPYLIPIESKGRQTSWFFCSRESCSNRNFICIQFWNNLISSNKRESPIQWHNV